ncbi:hypothetical protein [Ammoniphilus resinae]|uniref:Uncharacterized protein n=1 Tax=Ammoniphilus resinae TaxID=861532 RepID=A0ABS4GQ72_9BACL|nr:hypothetical protein [Ammoniphilus resinae]MBP1932371.1 hypothetical protein [Ammoniphilus resinae]
MNKTKVVSRPSSSRKPMVLKAKIANKTRVVKLPARLSQRGENLRLQLFSDINFEGDRIVFNAGEVAVRDMRILGFNDVLSSFRMRNSDERREVSLVLFEDINYQGDFKIYRGSRNIRNLVDEGFNDLASSLVFVARRISNSRVRQIQRDRRPPGAVLEIRR